MSSVTSRLNDIIAIVLAGGEGSRLKPLTDDRAKPAVPFGGKYRIIDFTLANCLHSGIHRVLVLTQYKSHSLHKHLRDGWSIFNPELGEYITPVPAQMRIGTDWYKGTANAIYQNLYLLERSDAFYVLILSGDHIYRMDYAAMLEFHIDHDADVTVACMDVSLDEARHFGVMSTDDELKVKAFVEKPEHPAPLSGQSDRALASMGVYIFSRDLLAQSVSDDHDHTDSHHDFGRDILPGLIKDRRVFAYRFGESGGRVSQDRYWRDVGTIDAYYRANMDLLKRIPPLNLYQKEWPIRTYQPQTPPARTVPGKSGNEGVFINSILASGVVIAGGSVQHSTLFSHVFVGDEACVEGVILFNHVHVGDRARLRNCIVDKYVEIPPDEEIGYDIEQDRRRFMVSDDGIVVVPKGYHFK